MPKHGWKCAYKKIYVSEKISLSHGLYKNTSYGK